MLRLIFSLTFILIFLACGRERLPGEQGSEKKSIVGGKLIRKSSYKSVVAITYDQDIHCTGTVISSNAVLTAAHCLVDVHTSGLGIYVGNGYDLPNHNLKVKPNYRISKVLLHPSVKTEISQGITNLGEFGVNDIGIAFIEGEFKNLRPYPILSDPNKIRKLMYIGNSILVVGYGYTKELDPILDYTSQMAGLYGKKRKVEVPIVNIFSNEFDARTKGKDSCYKDSGGPAFVSNGKYLEILGVVSGSDGLCAEAEFPVYYGAVFDSICWLKREISELESFHTEFHCDRSNQILESCSQLPNKEAKLCANELSLKLLNMD